MKLERVIAIATALIAGGVLLFRGISSPHAMQEISNQTQGSLMSQRANKMGICHYTGSENNPYEYIEVATSEVEGYRNHPNDKIDVKSEKECANSDHKDDATKQVVIPTHNPNSIDNHRATKTEGPEETLHPEETHHPEETSHPEGTHHPDETPHPEGTHHPDETPHPEGTHHPDETPRPEGTRTTAVTDTPGSVGPTSTVDNTSTMASTSINITGTPDGSPTLISTTGTPGGVPTSISTTGTSEGGAGNGSATQSGTSHKTPAPPANKTSTSIPISTSTIAPTSTAIPTSTLNTDELINEIQRLHIELNITQQELDQAKIKLADAEKRALTGEISIQQVIELKENVKKLEADKEKLQNKIINLMESLLQSKKDENDYQNKLLFWTIALGLMGIVIGTLDLLAKNKKISTKSRSTGIGSINITSPVSRGSDALLEIKVSPGEFCEATLIYASGTRKPLESKLAGKDGKLLWPLKIPINVAPGKWKIRIHCLPSGAQQEREFNVT